MHLHEQQGAQCGRRHEHPLVLFGSRHVALSDMKASNSSGAHPAEGITPGRSWASAASFGACFPPALISSVGTCQPASVPCRRWQRRVGGYRTHAPRYFLWPCGASLSPTNWSERQCADADPGALCACPRGDRRRVGPRAASGRALSVSDGPRARNALAGFVVARDAQKDDVIKAARVSGRVTSGTDDHTRGVGDIPPHTNLIPIPPNDSWRSRKTYIMK
jgi:hypothetical protein